MDCSYTYISKCVVVFVYLDKNHKKRLFFLVWELNVVCILLGKLSCRSDSVNVLPLKAGWMLQLLSNMTLCYVILRLLYYDIGLWLVSQYILSIKWANLGKYFYEDPPTNLFLQEGISTIVPWINVGLLAVLMVILGLWIWLWCLQRESDYFAQHFQRILCF